MKISVFIIFALTFSASVYADNGALLNYFQEENRNITEIRIIEYVSNYYLDGGLLIVRGVKSANSFTGNWNDELFGIFYTNNDLKVIKPLEFIPTKRWYDYCVEAKRKGLNSFVVRFFGCSYADEKMTREYKVE